MVEADCVIRFVVPISRFVVPISRVLRLLMLRHVPFVIGVLRHVPSVMLVRSAPPFDPWERGSVGGDDRTRCCPTGSPPGAALRGREGGSGGRVFGQALGAESSSGGP
jgi:hypothetical protein